VLEHVAQRISEDARGGLCGRYLVTDVAWYRVLPARQTRSPAASIFALFFLFLFFSAATALADPPTPVDWNAPHGSRTYRPARADVPPVIDGVLDDDVWTRAPRDDRFASTRSKPYGLPSTEPTVVQVAFDDEYLYVAFRCAYSNDSARDDSMPADEQTLFETSERVGVLIDARLDHATARSFTTLRLQMAERETSTPGPR